LDDKNPDEKIVPVRGQSRLTDRNKNRSTLRKAVRLRLENAHMDGQRMKEK
jgi:hypothetical protein